MQGGKVTWCDTSNVGMVSSISYKEDCLLAPTIEYLYICNIES